MNVSSAIGFPFRGPHVWPNLGLVLLCLLIPVIGPIVVMGYMVGAERALAENIDAAAPRFDFGKFTFYLQRGVWPFLVGLVMGLILLPFMWGLIAVGIVGGALLGRHPWVGVAMIGGAVPAYLVLLTVYQVATAPLILKAGLQENFGAGFDLRFLGDYVKRVGLLALGVGLVMVVIIVPLSLVSLCALFVGPLVLSVWLQFVLAHVQMQLYREYLARGGTPIVIKPEPPAPAFPVIAPPPAAPQ
jgi:hypothetical protein